MSDDFATRAELESEDMRDMSWSDIREQAANVSAGLALGAYIISIAAAPAVGPAAAAAVGIGYGGYKIYDLIQAGFSEMNFFVLFIIIYKLIHINIIIEVLQETLTSKRRYW